MDSFLRPEVRALFRRWREVFAAAALLLLALWMALGGVGITRWLGYIIAIAAIGWALAAIQRVRFANGGDGPGVVQIRERRLAYFGPLDGGIMDVDDLAQLAFDPTSHPAPSWVLTGADGTRLAIPINAKGADGLFDVFAALPGSKTKGIMAVLDDPPTMLTTVWQRHSPLLH